MRAKRVLPLGSPKQRALLAVLLLHANEPVARDRLIEELWAEAPPATVNAVLNVYLTRLRRLLAHGNGDQPLETQPSGYVLRVPKGRLDADRFEALLERGQRERENGDAGPAAETLREALALWRGSAFADFAYDEFARREANRLEELRLIAVEERIEAELGLGRHDTLVPELEALVAEHPYRERLRGQLMLALYRSGRQAEALETYRRARRTFVDELGIEPGPRLQALENAILRQDPSLDLRAFEPPRAEREGTEQPTKRRWGPRLALAIAAAAVLATAGVLVAAVRSPSTHSPTSGTPMTLAGNSVAVVDPDTDAVVGEIPVGGTPSSVAFGAGSVWVGNRDEETVLRIDPRSRKVVRRIGLGIVPAEVVFGGGSVWVLSDATETLLRIDPDTNDIVARVPRRRTGHPPWSRLAAGPNAVWVCACWVSDGELSRVDPATNSVATIRSGPVTQISSTERGLWVLAGFEGDLLERVDPRTTALISQISVGQVGETAGGYGAHMAAGEDAVWIAAYSGTTLWKVDAASERFVGSVELGRTPQSIEAEDGVVWVVTTDGTLFRVDAHALKVTKRARLGVFATAFSRAIATGGGAVWVAVTT